MEYQNKEKRALRVDKVMSSSSQEIPHKKKTLAYLLPRTGYLSLFLLSAPSFALFQGEHFVSEVSVYKEISPWTLKLMFNLCIG